MSFPARTNRAVSRTPTVAVMAALAVWLAGALAPASVPVVHAAAFVVNDLGDAVDAAPGNGVCATAGAVCTLRAAIQEANAAAGPDTITCPSARSPSPWSVAARTAAPPATSTLTATSPSPVPARPAAACCRRHRPRLPRAQRGEGTRAACWSAAATPRWRGWERRRHPRRCRQRADPDEHVGGQRHAFRNDVGNATGAGGGVANLGKERCRTCR
ncbi:MAG: CSLREA domain-containing protein [Dehalococcoidia bacterium]